MLGHLIRSAGKVAAGRTGVITAGHTSLPVDDGILGAGSTTSGRGPMIAAGRVGAGLRTPQPEGGIVTRR
ncbi:MAG: hypothetical protein K2X49_07710 [Acetobacteraceae bacterium]|nr:hypothetical protein [Acetobacteraceae bacterium]